jgi:NADPH2:quinone reductase
MVHGIRVHELGGPEVLRYESFDVPAPKAGEARIRHAAIGLNFIDCYYRSGLYPPPAGLPLIPGNEGAGTVTAVGRSEERRVGKACRRLCRSRWSPYH